MRSMKYIYWVCTSNTCRSPIAQALCREYLEENGLSEYEARSRALTDAYEPEDSPAADQSHEVMKELYDIDMSPHRSKMLSEGDLWEADCIIGMTRGHVNAIYETHPAAQQNKDKLLFFPEDVPDPWHQPEHIYKRCAQKLRVFVFDFLDVKFGKAKK